MILLLSCMQNSWKWAHIRTHFLEPCQIPYVILVGNPNLHRASHLYDASSHILQIGCADNYDELVYKIAYGISAIIELFDPGYLLKIDDDVVVNVSMLHRFIQSDVVRPDKVGSYCGVKVDITRNYRTSIESHAKYVYPHNKRPIALPPLSYCGGPMYYLSQTALQILSQHMDPDVLVFEDANVGKTLGDHGIHPIDVPLYSNDVSEFIRSKCIGWHDVVRKHPQNVFIKTYPSQKRLLQSRFLDVLDQDNIK